MTSAQGPVAVFSDLASNIWGVLCGGAEPRLAAAACNGEQPAACAVALAGDGSVWTVTGPGCSLRIEPAEPSSATAEAALVKPCRVAGELTLNGVAHELHAVGVRGDLDAVGVRGDLDAGGVRGEPVRRPAGQAARLFASWFPSGQELALHSSRRHGAPGHGQDSIGVVARGEEHQLIVDPRLSTTYNGAGEPLRVGVELWLGEAGGGEHENLVVRRVAGRATGAVATVPTLRAYAFACVSRGESGVGVYLTADPAR